MEGASIVSLAEGGLKDGCPVSLLDAAHGGREGEEDISLENGYLRNGA